MKTTLSWPHDASSDLGFRHRRYAALVSLANRWEYATEGDMPVERCVFAAAVELGVCETSRKALVRVKVVVEPSPNLSPNPTLTQP